MTHTPAMPRKLKHAAQPDPRHGRVARDEFAIAEGVVRGLTPAALIRRQAETSGGMRSGFM